MKGFFLSGPAIIKGFLKDIPEWLRFPGRWPGFILPEAKVFNPNYAVA